MTDDPQESVRLHDQALTLVELHGDTGFAAGSAVLEVGCWVGVQNYPPEPGRADHRDRHLGGVGRPGASPRRARGADQRDVRPRRRRRGAVRAPASFDHVFVCFVLEHLADPVAALATRRGLLKPGGTITVMEGDHGSTFFHPETDTALAAIGCQVRLQAAAGGDAKIGRRLYPLFDAAGFAGVRVSPRNVYVDPSRPSLVDGFTRKTFTAMIEGVRAQALAHG